MIKSKKANLFLFRLVRKVGFTQAFFLPWQVSYRGGSPDKTMCNLGAKQPQSCAHESSGGSRPTRQFLLWVLVLLTPCTESRSRHNWRSFSVEISLWTGARVLCSPDPHVKEHQLDLSAIIQVMRWLQFVCLSRRAVEDHIHYRFDRIQESRALSQWQITVTVRHAWGVQKTLCWMPWMSISRDMDKCTIYTPRGGLVYSRSIVFWWALIIGKHSHNAIAHYHSFYSGWPSSL